MPRFDTQWNSQQITILQGLTILSSILSLLGTLFIAYSYIFVQTNTPFSKRRTKKNRKKIMMKMQELEKSRRLLQKHLEDSLEQQIQSLEQELLNETPQETDSFLRFNKFVFYLSLAHLCNSIIWILLIAFYSTQNELYCEILVPINVYLFGCSFCWTVLIATEICYRFSHSTVSLFGETVIPETISGVKEIWFHLFAWVAPVLVVVLPVIRGDFGIGVWSCWVNDPDDGWVYIFGAIVALAMLYCTSAYVYVMATFRKRLEMSGILGEEERSKAVFLQTRVSTYLLVFLLCWMPAFLRNIIGLFDPPATLPLFILTAVGAFFMPLNGFLDALVYGTNRPLWEKMYSHVMEYCCCWCGCCFGWLFCCSGCCVKPGYEEIDDESASELTIQDAEDF